MVAAQRVAVVITLNKYKVSIYNSITQHKLIYQSPILFIIFKNYLKALMYAQSPFRRHCLS